MRSCWGGLFVVLLFSRCFGDNTDKKGSNITTRIVGGGIAPADGYPFFVSVRQWGNSHCGGVLIHPDFVLTSAHCNDGGLTVVVGANKNENVGARYIRRILQHPAYNEPLQRFDFLLLQLEEPVTDIDPIEWNTQHHLPMDAESLTVIGLGSTELGGQHTNVLREVTVPVVTYVRCDTLYGGRIDNVSQICAGSFGTDACQGDSGGPLLSENGVLMGVVSWGWFCGVYPGVYGRVSAASAWLGKSICDFTRTNRPSYCFGEQPPDPLAGKLPVFVETTFDRYPFEASWSLRDANTNEVIAEYPDYTFINVPPFETIKDLVYLEPGSMYSLELYDLLGDGWCCRFGEGSFRVYTVAEIGEEITIVGDRAVFGGSRVVPFRVVSGPPVPSSSPSSSDCRDSPSDFCAWLAESTYFQGILCAAGVRVASFCPLTCSQCHSNS